MGSLLLGYEQKRIYPLKKFRFFGVTDDSSLLFAFAGKHADSRQT